jgi:hypothetical protein
MVAAISAMLVRGVSQRAARAGFGYAAFQKAVIRAAAAKWRFIWRFQRVDATL